MWIWLAVAQGACPDDAEAELTRRAEALDAAYDAVDESGFAKNYEALHALVPCLNRALDPKTIVAWHRARALGEFFEREEIASAKSWAAVKVLDPDYAPPDGWIVEGTPLHKAWTEAPVTDARIDLERTPEGGWRVDGTESGSVPADRAFILQGFDSTGAVVHTDYHYSVAEVPVVDFEALDKTARDRRRRRMRRYGTALASVLGAGAIGTLTAAWSEEQAVQSFDTPLEDVPTRAQRANTLSSVGLGLGVAGAGVATTTWVVRW